MKLLENEIMDDIKVGTELKFCSKVVPGEYTIYEKKDPTGFVIIKSNIEPIGRRTCVSRQRIIRCEFNTSAFNIYIENTTFLKLKSRLTS